MGGTEIMLSPTQVIVRRQKIEIELDAARYRGDVTAMQACLAELTWLIRIQFGSRSMDSSLIGST